MLVGGARETPGSAAAGVGVAAAEEGAGSAVRVGSDSKESPISACSKSPKKGSKTKPQKSNQKDQLSHRYHSEQKQAKRKVQFKSSPIKTFLVLSDQRKIQILTKIKVEKCIQHHPVITNK